MFVGFFICHTPTWCAVNESNLKKLIITDTIPLPPEKQSDKIVVLSLADAGRGGRSLALGGGSVGDGEKRFCDARFVLFAPARRDSVDRSLVSFRFVRVGGRGGVVRR